MSLNFMNLRFLGRLNFAFLCALVAILIVWGCIPKGAAPAKASTPIKNKGPYETVLGRLNHGATSAYNAGGGLWEYHILSSNAIIVNGGVEILKKQIIKTKRAPRITFVQDEATADWVATNGEIYGADIGNWFLLNDHQVKIIGGKDRPLLIDGQPFFDSDLIIVDGKPTTIQK